MDSIARLFLVIAIAVVPASGLADDGGDILCPLNEVGIAGGWLVGENPGGMGLVGENPGGMGMIGFWSMEGLGGGGLVSATPIHIPRPPSSGPGDVSATPINTPAPESLSLLLTDENGYPVGFLIGERVDPDPIDVDPDPIDEPIDPEGVDPDPIDDVVWFGDYSIFTGNGLVFGSFVLATDGQAVNGAFLGACAAH